MKKKLITMLLLSTIALCLCSCGSSESLSSKQTGEDVSEQSKKDSDVNSSNEEQSVEEAPNEEPADDGVIDFTTEKFNLKYVKHEIGSDYEETPALIIYYEYTNLADEASNFMMNVSDKLFQNGIQLESAMLMDSPDEYGNSMLDVQKGSTITVATAHTLQDTDNPVTLEISELMSFNDEKDTQEISLK